MNRRIFKKKYVLHTSIYRMPMVTWNTKTPKWKRRKAIIKLSMTETYYWGFTPHNIELSEK